jgi:hypothetical protein
MATVTDFIMTGVIGQSSRVGTLEIATITLNEASSAALPKTGCLDSPEYREGGVGGRCGGQEGGWVNRGWGLA